MQMQETVPCKQKNTKKENPIEISIPVTKYDLWKSSLMVSTTRSRATGPSPATSSSRSGSGLRGSDGDRKTDAAIPSSSDPYHASLSNALSDWESRSGGDVLRLALHRKLHALVRDFVGLCRKWRRCGVREG